GALGNQGVWMRPIAIRYVLDSQRRLLEENTPQGKQVLAPEVAYVITHMLEGTIERGTGAAAKALGRPAAAKTGTTNDYSNAWFIGYTPRLATGVWVGYDRPKSLGRDETGSRVAVPIWTSFMAEALAGTSVVDFQIPERVVVVPVDLFAGGNCLRPVMMAFVGGTDPGLPCGPAKHAPPTAVAPVPTPVRPDPAEAAPAPPNPQSPSPPPPSHPSPASASAPPAPGPAQPVAPVATPTK